jgi:hypothetical protein
VAATVNALSGNAGCAKETPLHESKIITDNNNFMKNLFNLALYIKVLKLNS